MKMSKLINIGKIISTAVVVLGIVHDVATFTPLIAEGISCLPSNKYNAMIYMSLMCGTAFILSGILLFMLLNNLEEYSFLIKPIFVLAIFLIISGISSVVYMPGNPFAWITFILNLAMFCITLALNRIIIRTN